MISKKIIFGTVWVCLWLTRGGYPLTEHQLLDALEFYITWPFAQLPPDVQAGIDHGRTIMPQVIDEIEYIMNTYRRGGASRKLFGIQSLTSTGQKKVRQALETITVTRRALTEKNLAQDGP